MVTARFLECCATAHDVVSPREGTTLYGLPKTRAHRLRNVIMTLEYLRTNVLLGRVADRSPAEGARIQRAADRLADYATVEMLCASLNIDPDEFREEVRKCQS